MPDGCVIGAGIDLVENERMQAVLDRWGAAFRNKVFLPSEQAYCEQKAFPCRHYAARFAVKEAVAKAFGTGVTAQLSWRDIEVLRDGESGAPSVRLSRRGRCLADRRCIVDILISLSHTHNYAVAQAILVGQANRKRCEKTGSPVNGVVQTCT